MRQSLTIVYTTARHEPRIEWFLDSLYRQPDGPSCKVIVVDPFRKPAENASVRVVNPKPTVWQGPYRLTKQDWWAASNARNTGICLCDTDWVGFVDDRSVLIETWLEAVKAAKVGDRVRLEWVEGEGYNITMFEVLKKKKDEDKKDK